MAVWHYRPASALIPRPADPATVCGPPPPMTASQIRVASGRAYIRNKARRPKFSLHLHAECIVGFRQGYLRKLPMLHAIFLPCNYLEWSPIIFPCSGSPRIDLFASVALHGPMLLCPSLICNAARNPRAFRSTARFSSPNPRGFLSDSSVDIPSGLTPSSHRYLCSFAPRMAGNAIIKLGLFFLRQLFQTTDLDACRSGLLGFCSISPIFRQKVTGTILRTKLAAVAQCLCPQFAFDETFQNQAVRI